HRDQRHDESGAEAEHQDSNQLLAAAHGTLTILRLRAASPPTSHAVYTPGAVRRPAEFLPSQTSVCEPAGNPDKSKRRMRCPPPSRICSWAVPGPAGGTSMGMLTGDDKVPGLGYAGFKFQVVAGPPGGGGVSKPQSQRSTFEIGAILPASSFAL